MTEAPGPFWTDERRDEFWEEFKVLLDRYPEVINGMDKAYEDHEYNCEDNDNKPYDHESTKYISGLVILVGIRNLDDFELGARLSPKEQSIFITEGLLSKSFKMW